MKVILYSCLTSTLCLFLQAWVSHNDYLHHHHHRYHQQGFIKSRTQLYAELRILIHGTKNAYTTLRNHDVIIYQLTKSIEGRTRALGVYKSDNTVMPLCNEYLGSSEFYEDVTSTPLLAERLKEDRRILRIISSDRRGNSYSIEEYIDNDVYIPIKGATSSSTSNVSDLPVNEESIEDVEQRIAELELKLAELKLKALQSKLAENGEKVTLVRINTGSAPLPVGPYSQAIKANGFLFISGCIGIVNTHIALTPCSCYAVIHSYLGIDPSSNKLVSSEFKEQTEQLLSNLKFIISEAGSEVSKICKTTIFVTNLSQYAEINRIYCDFLLSNDVTIFPARSTVQVAALPMGALVEIEATVVA